MSTDFEIRNRALELQAQLSESFGEVTDESEAELDAILQEVDEPISYLFFMQKHAEAQAAECKELADIYAVRRKSWDSKRAAFKKRMQSLLEALEALGEEPKRSGHWGTASLSSSTRAVVDDLELLPDELVKVYKAPKKADVLKRLRARETIKGAFLKTSKNLTIRSK